MVGFTDGNSAPNARQIPMAPDRGHNGYVWTKASQMSATDGDMPSRLRRYSRDAHHGRRRGANCLKQIIARNSQGHHPNFDAGQELRKHLAGQFVSGILRRKTNYFGSTAIF